MIVSRSGKSYDTSDGSEQPHAPSAARPDRSEREEINRWEDDGPGPHAHAAPAPVSGAPRKPAWSVVSLRGLLDAVRRLGRNDAPARRRQQAERAERDCVAADQGRRTGKAMENANSDLYRNAWENT